jgi:regulator of replication initiation timing
MTSTNTEATTAWDLYDRTLATLDEAWARLRTCESADLTEALLALAGAQAAAWNAAGDLYPNYGDRFDRSVGYNRPDPEDWMRSLIRSQENALSDLLTARGGAVDGESDEAVRAAFDALHAELQAVRAERDRAVREATHLREGNEALRDDLIDRAVERNDAERQLAEALVKLDDVNELHADCATVADLEAQKDLTKAAAADAKTLRTQRNILAAVAVIIAVLAVASVLTWA